MKYAVDLGGVFYTYPVVESDVSSACQAIASSTLHVGVVHSTCGTV